VGYILARCPVLPDHFTCIPHQRRQRCDSYQDISIS